MSLHIHRFVDRVRSSESKGQTSVILSMQAAKDLHADITKLLLALQQQQEKSQAGERTVTVELTGGSFKNT